jgi:hypothetical protein
MLINQFEYEVKFECFYWVDIKLQFLEKLMY